jgi:hypothetical protein
MPRGRTTAAFVLAFAVAGCSHPPGGGIKKNDAVLVETRPVPLDFSIPERDTVGRLRYRGGLALRSPDERLGGLSGLLIHPDGGAFIAVSDNGYWIGANLIHDENGNLADIADMTITPTLGPDGRPLRSASERDAEALARAPEEGIFVAFERDHRLWRYDEPGALPAPVEGPAEFGAQPSSESLEALTTLADERFACDFGRLEDRGRHGRLGTRCLRPLEPADLAEASGPPAPPSFPTAMFWFWSAAFPRSAPVSGG